ncbi:MAG: flavin reductase family protein [Beijerinckiaceae bacterium]|jgi:flavin reductase (DIM6/NTAB) family NADH-FMN oxidoreductase RutF|nr:flavin reductase family protein [Beijerinckiaceae bacterium]
MFYEPRLRNHGLSHDPLKALVAPRPIGWISTMAANGSINLAPYSFFNLVGDRPPIAMFSSDGQKDSLRNAEETGEFVCNIVTTEFTAAMNASSAPFPHGVNEFEKAGLAMEPSCLVKPPRVKGIAAALECKVTSIQPLAGADGNLGPYIMVLGEAVGVYVDEKILKDGRVDAAHLPLLARLGYMDYSSVERVFSLERPTVG